MKIIIVGAGRIGSNLAESLSAENHEVYLIEKDKDTARKADEKIDVKVICGNGADPETLKKVSVHEADLVISVTMSDETNLVVCSLADFFGAKKQVARVRNTSLSRELGISGYEHFNIDAIINPEELAAEAIVKAVDAPGACEVGDFAEGKILLRAFDIPERSPLCGSKIEDFSQDDFPWPFLIVAIRRNNDVVIPKGATCIESNDRIYALLPEQSLGEFLVFLEPDKKKTEKVIIYGATIIGEMVAEALSDHIAEVVLLEENASMAVDVAGKLKAVRVINGAASEQDILKEAGIEVADIFVAASKSDQANLVSSVLAKKLGAKRAIITTQQPDYVSIVDSLNIDAIINPHLLAVEQILRFVRGGGISSVTKLLECDAEALEFVTEEGAAVTKGPIKNISFPKEAIVGAVCRGNEVFLAKGDTCIQAGEKVIVFCQDKAIKKLQSLFTKKNLF